MKILYVIITVYQNKSLWVPVLSIRSVSSVSFCSQMSNQSGPI